MLERLTAGGEIDGFRLGECIHSGAQGLIFQVTRPDKPDQMIMKVPRFGQGEAAENLISFETEVSILPALSGPHVPRFIAAGTLESTPYLVTEWVEGESLETMLKRGSLRADQIQGVGAALADALHSLHRQDAIHLDVKPDNVIVKPNGKAVLIDFGLAHHARYPDLLAQEQRFAAGSAPYISPEQMLGTRSDPRSDIFSLGVVLYEMVTGELPFGIPRTMAGMRDRLWMDPIPPCAHSIETTPWLQEIILRCLEPDATARYQSASHVAFDLRHPQQIRLTERSTKLRQAGFCAQARRWWLARGERSLPRRLPNVQVSTAPIIMVAVDTTHPHDERLPALQRVTGQVLSLSAEFRLACVAVIGAGPMVEGKGEAATASGIHREHLVRLRHWVAPLNLPPHRLALHVIVAASPADALLEFARQNHIDLILLGAPRPSQHALAWWRSAASAVTAHAHCSVHVVRVPGAASEDESVSSGPSGDATAGEGPPQTPAG